MRRAVWSAATPAPGTSRSMNRSTRRQETREADQTGRWSEPFRLGSALRGSEPRPRLLSLGIQRRGETGRSPLPGNYQVRVTANGKSATAPLEVKIDPRVTTSQADLEKQFKLEMDLREQLNRVYDAVNQIQDVREQLNGLKKRLVPGDSTKALCRWRQRSRREAGCRSRSAH